jgi:glycosyltransferase involved in cell wall biosynthesis
MTHEPTRWIAIAWAPYSRRSEMFARELGGDLHCIHYLRFRYPPHAPLKYALQTVRTLKVLFHERPDAVHVQNPPVVCGLVVALYGSLTGVPFVVEYHSAAFGRAWRWALPLQRLVARRAAANIVTSDHWAEIVRSWGGDTIVMYDAFLDLPAGRPFDVRPGFNVAFLGTFAPDEPIEAVLAAACELPDVRFYVTGDPSQAGRGLVERATPNVVFTGFLDPAGEYLGLLRAVDAAIVLTTRDHTLQLAGCEAISVGTPIVTSDWPYLRELFAMGALFVGHDATSIRDGVVEMVRRRDELARDTATLRRIRQEEWRTRLGQLRRLTARARAERARVPRGVQPDGVHDRAS